MALIVSAFLLAAAATPALETALPSDIPPDAVFYTQEDVKRTKYPSNYYPPEAKAAKVDGDVVVSCELNVDGTLKRCAVIFETQPNMGFGKPTAIRFLKDMRVETPEGGFKPGSWKKLKFRWRYKDL